MKLDLYFSFEDQINYLRKQGYIVGKRTERMWWSVYHNDTEEADVEIWYVQKNGMDYKKPVMSHYSFQEWVEDVFEEEIRSKLKKFILTL